MMNRLIVVALLAVVGCKSKESASAEPVAPVAADSAAARAGEAAAALARAAAALATAASAAATPAPSAAASAKPVASAESSGFSAQIANQLGRLGISTGANDLIALGRDRGALLAGLGRLANQPAALSAVLDNDKVVSAFMKRS